MARKYFIETFGCQMNFHDSERVAGLLHARGYVAADTEREADVIVVNTCSVRERAVDKLHSRLGEIRLSVQTGGEKPVIAVMGCVAQQEGEKLPARDPSIDVVVGTQRLKELPALVEEALRHQHPRRPRVVDVSPHDDVSFPLGVAQHSDAVRAFLDYSRISC